MVNELKLGKLADLELTVEPSAVASALTLWGLFTWLGVKLLKRPVTEAMAGGFAGMMLHWVAEMSHQLGHANAARETGYPMTGVRFRLLIGISEYPGGEPDLPPDVHIRRALGGPTRSLRVTLLAGLLALLTRPLGAIPTWLGIFFFLDNLLVMTIGAFLPLGFTDGSTILHWRKVKRDA